MALTITRQYTPATRSVMLKANSVADTKEEKASMTLVAPLEGVRLVNLPVTKRVSETLNKPKTQTYDMLINSTGVPTCPASIKYVNLNGINIRMGPSAKSYNAAADDCQANGGFLAKISTPEELLAMQILNGTWFKELKTTNRFTAHSFSCLPF